MLYATNGRPKRREKHKNGDFARRLAIPSFANRLPRVPNAFPESPTRSRAATKSGSIKGEPELGLDTTPPSSYSPTPPLPRGRGRVVGADYSFIRL